MRTALIVGASRGLGRALTERLLADGWRVIATARSPSSLEDLANAQLRVEPLDIVDRTAIEALAGRLANETADLLFVVAGIALADETPIGEVPPADFERLMQVNALAPLAVIDAFAPLVPATGTVAAMTSGLASITANEAGGREAYRMSKAALNMGLRSLAIRRAAEGRTYLAISPGWVRTEMGGDSAPLSIDQSIAGILKVLDGRRGSGGIAFVAHDGREWPW